MLDRYQTFIFDLDGTLVDSVPDLALALNHALNEQGLESVTQQQVRQWVGNGSKKLVERALESMDQWNEFHQQTLHHQFLKSYEKFLNCESQLYPKTLELLQTLKANHKTLALLTNKPIQFVRPLLSVLGIVEYFSIMLGGDSLPEKKPSPLPLLHIMESLEQSPEQCVMIGDSRSDVLCAQAAHVDCILLEQGYNQGLDLSQLNPTMLLRNCADLLCHLSANS
jgi:phosphoglycolate phosphatase